MKASSTSIYNYYKNKYAAQSAAVAQATLEVGHAVHAVPSVQVKHLTEQAEQSFAATVGS